MSHPSERAATRDYSETASPDNPDGAMFDKIYQPTASGQPPAT